MLPDRRWIETHIPQKGRMCLLEEVLGWDTAHLRARSGTHRAADHPLAVDGCLAAICGIEYAAQAMAVHGALLAQAANVPDAPPLAGYIASIRDVQLHVARLDDIATDLIAEGHRLMASERTASYELLLSSAGRMLVQARATVVFDAAGLVGLTAPDGLPP